MLLHEKLTVNAREQRLSPTSGVLVGEPLAHALGRRGLDLERQSFFCLWPWSIISYSSTSPKSTVTSLVRVMPPSITLSLARMFLSLLSSACPEPSQWLRNLVCRFDRWYPPAADGDRALFCERYRSRNNTRRIGIEAAMMAKTGSACAHIQKTDPEA